MSDAIFLMIDGQSNGFGEADNSTLDTAFKQTFPLIPTWGGSSFSSLDYLVNNNQYPAPLNNAGGVEFSLATRMQTYFGKPIYLVKYAVPDTALGTADSASANWLPSTQNSYFNSARTTLLNAMANVWHSTGARSFTVYYVSLRGERDSKNLTNTNAYQANLDLFYTQLDKYLGTSTTVYYINALLATTLFQTANKNTIIGATNANPIVIQTAEAHTLSTGNLVYTKDVGGNTAANQAVATITNIDATHFSIPYAGNGNYTSGGAWSPFVYVPQINTAATAAAAMLPSRRFVFPTDAFQKDSLGVHYTALGYKNMGDYIMDNIIIANNLR